MTTGGYRSELVCPRRRCFRPILLGAELRAAQQGIGSCMAAAACAATELPPPHRSRAHEQMRLLLEGCHTPCALPTRGLHAISILRLPATLHRHAISRHLFLHADNMTPGAPDREYIVRAAHALQSPPGFARILLARGFTLYRRNIHHMQRMFDACGVALPRFIASGVLCRVPNAQWEVIVGHLASGDASTGVSRRLMGGLRGSHRTLWLPAPTHSSRISLTTGAALLAHVPHTEAMSLVASDYALDIAATTAKSFAVTILPPRHIGIMGKERAMMMAYGLLSFFLDPTEQIVAGDNPAFESHECE